LPFSSSDTRSRQSISLTSLLKKVNSIYLQNSRVCALDSTSSYALV
jgi:hypothetical protein